jgi:hypothetical protein
MKSCNYCGRENADDAICCRECGTREFKNPASEASEPVEPMGTAPEPAEPEVGTSHLPKVCDYCGRENLSEAVYCRECGTALKSPVNKKLKAPEIPPRITASDPVRWKFKELTAAEKKLDLVTLLTCRTLVEADVIVGQLASGGVDAFIPDEFLAQAMSWNLNAFGYVRVQVSPGDYERAKTLLLAMSTNAELGAPPNSGPATPPR